MNFINPFAGPTSDPSVEIERAVSELRYGRPIVLRDSRRAFAVLALDAVQPKLYDQFAEVSGQAHRLLLTKHRARSLGTMSTTDITVPLAGVDFDAASRLSYALEAEQPTDWQEADPLASASAELARIGLLLPAMVCAEVTDRQDTFGGCIGLDARHLDARLPARSDFQIVVRTKVPLEDYGLAEFVVFRGGLAQKDQVAIIVGKPDAFKAVPIRIHSSCITGDLCGSLKCDCGDQLRNGLALLAQSGGGILLYLDQEGRGTGIGAKMRAYGYQHRGLDTIDADAALGLGADHRRYEAAVAMLKLLEVPEVVVYTNNPTKIGGLRKGGIVVHARTPVTGRVTVENEGYLRTKALRAGHLLDVDAMIAAE